MTTVVFGAGAVGSFFGGLLARSGADVGFIARGAQLDALCRDGIRIDSDHGEASERGFTLAWSYDASAEELHIQCTKKPFVVPCGMVKGRIAYMPAEQLTARDVDRRTDVYSVALVLFAMLAGDSTSSSLDPPAT